MHDITQALVFFIFTPAAMLLLWHGLKELIAQVQAFVATPAKAVKRGDA
jgi:hypothetical protein